MAKNRPAGMTCSAGRRRLAVGLRPGVRRRIESAARALALHRRAQAGGAGLPRAWMASGRSWSAGYAVKGTGSSPRRRAPSTFGPWSRPFWSARRSSRAGSSIPTACRKTWRWPSKACAAVRAAPSPIAASKSSPTRAGSSTSSCSRPLQARTATKPRTRISRVGECFAYVKVDASQGLEQERFESKSELEDAREAVLLPAGLSCQIGGGTGLRYS